MQRRIILLAVLLIASCSGQQPSEITIDHPTQPTFEALPGEIGLALHGSDIAFQVLIRHGKIEPVTSNIKAPREATGMIAPYGATMLPDRTNEYYRGPFAFSPNGKYVAASVVGHRPKTALPQAFVIFDRQGKRDLTRIDLSDEELLRALAWSPDSTRIAILKSTSKGKVSFKNFLSALSGHPVAYDTYFLDIYDLEGKIVAHTKLIEDVRYSWGEIVWMPL